MKRIYLYIAILAVLIVLLIVVTHGPAGPVVKTEYQAVTLTSGAVYYGRLSGLETPYPRLSDVFTIEPQFDPDRGVQNSTLVRRAGAWHEPSFMLLNAQHIVAVEPVAMSSRVAQLIRATPKQ
jgi:hypothetical protein